MRQLEKNQVVPQSLQDEALARWSTPREVRSATICLAYLMMKKRVRLEEAFEFVCGCGLGPSPLRLG